MSWFGSASRSSLSAPVLLAITLAALLAFGVPSGEGVAVMSVDLGSEFMKVGIVKPGVPMEIVLNKESRRKTPLVVSLRSESEREFGEMAMSQAIKNPKTAYLYLTQLLAKSLDNPAVQAYAAKYPYYDIREDPLTRTIYFQHDAKTRYTPEELLAMLLEYARELAADFGEQAIDAAVIAVPAYYNQAERKAVLRAAELVNLRVLQLVNTNIAAGLNYGVFRRKDFNNSGTTHMFVDMGAASITATVATFQLVKMKDDVEANPQLVVRGIGYDRELGGNEFTMRLAAHLSAAFRAKSGKDVRLNPKALLKIYKEAERVKNVLSANVDHTAQIESLMDDVDFKTKVTRDELEQLCVDLFPRIARPIKDAIASAGILPDEIASVILVGGSTRMPRIQDELLKASGKKELAKNLNTDEAPALGAVYQAAFMSKGYKVKKFYIKDVNLYPIQVEFERVLDSDEEASESAASGDDKQQAAVVKRVLFDRLNSYPQKKVMTFSKHTHSFAFRVQYAELETFMDERQVRIMGASSELAQVRLTDVEDVFGKHADDARNGIKVHFRMDNSGILHVDTVDVTFEKRKATATASGDKATTDEPSTLSKIGDTISSFFTGSSSSKTTPNDDEKVSTDETADKSSTESDADETTTPSTTTTTTPASTDDADKAETITPPPTASTPAPTANDTTTSSSTPKTAKAGSAKAAAAAANATASVKVERIAFESVDVDLVALEASRVAETRARLVAIKEKETEKRKRSVAINSLEAYIFDTRDKMDADEFVKCSTPGEREAIRGQLDEADMWLGEADDSVATKEFKDKLAALKAATKEPYFRMAEKRTRPKKLDELRDLLNAKSGEFLKSARNFTGPELAITQSDFDELEKMINTTKEWLAKAVKEQAKLSDSDSPKLLTSELADKADAIRREMSYLQGKITNYKRQVLKKLEKEKLKKAKEAAAAKEAAKKAKAKSEADEADDQANAKETTPADKQSVATEEPNVDNNNNNNNNGSDRSPDEDMFDSPSDSTTPAAPPSASDDEAEPAATTTKEDKTSTANPEL